MASHENQYPEIPPETLLLAYRQGIFPMNVDGELSWFSPDPRGILPIDGFHQPRGLRRALRSRKWEIRVDTCFQEVMLQCADRDETWIDECIFRSYSQLHAMGCAHSVEVWVEGNLAGGLYGVRLGAAFFGESMFHRVTDASKIALCGLIHILKTRGYELLDTQWTTSHLKQFGAVEIPRAEYLQRLKSALEKNISFPEKGRMEMNIFS